MQLFECIVFWVFCCKSALVIFLWNYIEMSPAINLLKLIVMLWPFSFCFQDKGLWGVLVLSWYPRSQSPSPFCCPGEVLCVSPCVCVLPHGCVYSPGPLCWDQNQWKCSCKKGGQTQKNLWMEECVCAFIVKIKSMLWRAPSQSQLQGRWYF